jgi:8-oxo-dGTP pyrophosphatase MutT (NUDIX family)
LLTVIWFLREEMTWILPMITSSSSLSVSRNRTTRTRSSFTTSDKNAYRGVQYWKLGVTLGSETLYETPFARFQIHQVLLEDGKTVVKDWLWLDESDVVNVLVENENEQFVVLHQSKYGIATPTYAIVGGLMEPEEKGNPLLTAQRELREELGMESDHWIQLGGYRTAANRGAGTTYTFLARHARKEGSTTTTTTGRGGDGPVEGELERQDVVLLTRNELVEKLLVGDFQEIKWTATIALALLRMMQEEGIIIGQSK